MALPRAWGPVPGKPKIPANQHIRTTPPKAPPKKPPKVPGAPVVKPLDPNVQAQQNAMGAFRSALAQLNQNTPEVNSAAIYAPYRASEQITGQLGQGFQQHVLDSGAAAQQQYGGALSTAQQQAAQFGISAGAGANPTALTNTGAAPLAEQTNAYAAAAPAAAAQWQALLERTAGAKVADAQLQRETGLTQARQSLATALPGAIQNERQLGFQQQTQRDNMNLARTQLTAKQRADLQDYSLGAAKVQTSAQNAAESAAIKREALAEKSATDKAKLKQGQQKLAQGQQSIAIRARAQQATAKGLKGVPAALKALSGTTSGGSTKKAAKGWDVTVQTMDPDTGEPTGDTKVIHLPDKRKIPKGFKYVSATTHYATVPNTPGKTGISASQWDQLMRGMIAQNPPGSTAAIKAFLGPRPKK